MKERQCTQQENYPKAVLALGKGSTKRDFILLRVFIQKNTLETFPSMISLR